MKRDKSSELKLTPPGVQAGGYRRRFLFRYPLLRSARRWRLTLPHTLSLPGSTLDQRSQSAEPVIIRGCGGSRFPPPHPTPPSSPTRRSINISQIRLQKNTVFILNLCKLRKRVSPSTLCGEPFPFFFFCLTEVSWIQMDESYWSSRPQRAWPLQM